MTDQIEARCPKVEQAHNCDLSNALEALRTTRDKTIAHNEVSDRSNSERAKWAQAERLIGFAQHGTSGLGIDYLGMADFSDNGTYVLSGDAGSPASQLHKMLDKAGVVPKRYRL